MRIPNGRIPLLTSLQFFVNVKRKFVMESCTERTNMYIAYLYILSASNFEKLECVTLSSLSINFDYIWHPKTAPRDAWLISMWSRLDQHNPLFLRQNSDVLNFLRKFASYKSYMTKLLISPNIHSLRFVRAWDTNHVLHFLHFFFHGSPFNFRHLSINTYNKTN